ncbi:kinase-like domain-containing protein, partial [Mycena vulgaris]
MSLDAALDVLLGMTPVPGLSGAFTLFRFIVSSVQAVQASKKQLEALAKAVGQLLATLDSEFREARLIVANCGEALTDLESLLQDIHRFVHKEQERGFFKSLLNKDSRIAKIEAFYRHIGITLGAFQISGLLRIQSMLAGNDTARNEDTNALNTRLQTLEHNQVDLQKTLDINQNNMLALMACIQRRLDSAHSNHPEQKFYSHTFQYLTSISGQQMKLEDWMISSFDVDYGAEIGAGGFSKVYRGTWNRTDVAIKVLQNVAGISPSPLLLRKEVDLWVTLRHPNILQFLGANTLDDTPFVVMPYIQHNARQFLEQQPAFDPVYILRDVSLGLQYLHSRKICHGDVKGVNILVEDSGRALLCDFGLSRIRSDITSRTTVGSTLIAGSRNWMAPELMAGSLPKMPSDIYAFGMTVYELYTDENPLSSIAPADFIELVFRLGVRPDRPEIEDVPKLTAPLWALAQQCWLQESKVRPTAGQVHDKIVDLISQMIAKKPAEPVVTNTRRTDDEQRQPSDLAHQKQDLLEKKLALGENHPDTLSSMYNLALAYSGLHKFKEAQELGLATMQKRKQVLGENHPDTLSSMYNLA